MYGFGNCSCGRSIFRPIAMGMSPNTVVTVVSPKMEEEPEEEEEVEEEEAEEEEGETPEAGDEE